MQDYLKSGLNSYLKNRVDNYIGRQVGSTLLLK